MAPQVVLPNFSGVWIKVGPASFSASCPSLQALPVHSHTLHSLCQSPAATLSCMSGRGSWLSWGPTAKGLQAPYLRTRGAHTVWFLFLCKQQAQHRAPLPTPCDSARPSSMQRGLLLSGTTQSFSCVCIKAARACLCSDHMKQETVCKGYYQVGLLDFADQCLRWSGQGCIRHSGRRNGAGEAQPADPAGSGPGQGHGDCACTWSV